MDSKPPAGSNFKSGPLGLGAARQRLVSRAQTEFCACIDADDINEPQRLEKQIQFLRTNPSIALVGSALRVIDKQGRPTGATYNFPLVHDDIVHVLLRCNCIGHPSVLFRRSAVLDVGNYDDRAPVEDYDLWLRLASRFRMANQVDHFVNYRLHSQSHTARITDGVVSERAVQTLANNAPTLFGLSTETAIALHSRMVSPTLWHALRISRHLEKICGNTSRHHLRSPSFLDSMRTFTGDGDSLSTKAYDFLDPRRGMLRAALRKMTGRSRCRAVPSDHPAPSDS